jgi:hypothetical protein
MKSLFYSWLTFQIFAGVWLFLSPFILGSGEFHIAINNMLFGALVVILAVGMAFYEFYHKERLDRGSTFLQNLFYLWIAFQVVIGIWLFISPILLGYPETHMAYNDMLFGSLTVVLGIGTFFFQVYHREEFEILEHAKQRV